jgi:hypothetical protein
MIWRRFFNSLVKFCERFLYKERNSGLRNLPHIGDSFPHISIRSLNLRFNLFRLHSRRSRKAPKELFALIHCKKLHFQAALKTWSNPPYSSPASCANCYTRSSWNDWKHSSRLAVYRSLNKYCSVPRSCSILPTTLWEPSAVEIDIRRYLWQQTAIKSPVIAQSWSIPVARLNAALRISG